MKFILGKIECMICYENVGRNVFVWLCLSCYFIFYMFCVRKWVCVLILLDILVFVIGNGEVNWRCFGC